MPHVGFAKGGEVSAALVLAYRGEFKNGVLRKQNRSFTVVTDGFHIHLAALSEHDHLTRHQRHHPV